MDRTMCPYEPCSTVHGPLASDERVGAKILVGLIRVGVHATVSQ